MREELHKLGFSKVEAAIYLVLLNLGTAIPSTLSRMTGVKRPTVYAALKRLEDKNLVYSYEKGRIRYFIIDDPKKILLQEKEKFEAAESLVEKLKDLKQPLNLIDVNYYKGIEGYRAIYEDILMRKPKEVIGWINLDQFYKGLEMKKENQWTRKRIRNKIFARLVMQKTELAKKFQVKDKSSFRETRFSSQKDPFSTTCFLYNDSICLFDSSGEILGLRIENQEISKMFKNIFEMNWEFLAKKQNKN